MIVTVQPSAKLQQMMHRNGKKAVSRRITGDFRKKKRKHLAEYIMAELLRMIRRNIKFRWKNRMNSDTIEDSCRRIR